MATHLDLEEQEQLDQLKHFWRKYGNLLSAVIVLVLGAVAAWNGWQMWQRHQGGQAGAMFDEVDRWVQAHEADKAAAVFADMRERFAGTVFTAQAGLLTAQVQFDKGQKEAARNTLQWLVQNAAEAEYKSMARLRLAGVLMDEKKLDEAQAVLAGDWPKAFAPLAADRRGDILVAQGKPAEALAAYRSAYDGLDAQLDYRRLVEAKLTALGGMAPAAPAAASAPVAASGASR